MKVLRNYPLSKITSFHTSGYVEEVVVVESIADIKEIILSAFSNYDRYMVLGGGSNVLFKEDYDGLIIHPNLKGIAITRESQDHIYIQAASGEIWDEVVAYCTLRNMGGLENLSLIPGSTGAAPIQNIGAYGTELSDVFDSLQAIDLHTGDLVIFNKQECEFSYRGSIFKGELRDTFLITSVTFRLDKHPKPKTGYKDLLEEIEKRGIAHPDIRQVREMVCDIRRRKLPDPLKTGNAGSFFKNPEIDTGKYRDLIKHFPDLVAYKLPNEKYKIAAGWMIDQCGWKGKRFGDAGVHEKQALVLVNHGDASGSDIIRLAGRIKESVYQTFGIELSEEVNII